jgi:hypothetical protein
MEVPTSAPFVLDREILVERWPLGVRFMQAAARVDFGIYFRPSGSEDWAVFADDHITGHKVGALRYDFYSRHGLYQPMHVAVDLGRPLAIHRKFHDMQVPDHTFVTYPESILTEETWPRFFMTAFERARTMPPYPRGFPNPLRQSRAEAGEAQAIYNELTDQEVEPYSNPDIHYMIVDALKENIARRPELALEWVPKNAADVVKLGSGYRSCRPCLNIAGVSVDELDALYGAGT